MFTQPLAISRLFWPSARCLIIASGLALAGCATNPSNSHADSGSSSNTARNSYLSRTQSDPLGAYLAESPYSPGKHKPLAATALNFVGTKYRYGGDTPNTGFDCSGLVAYAAEKSLGLKLPRRSADIAHEGVSIKRSELRKGDLVFFNTRGARNSHVGIYLGDHKFVHAPRTGASIRVDSMDVAYWRKRYNGARRLQAQPETARR